MQKINNLLRFSCLILITNILFSTPISAQVEFEGKGIVGKWRVVDLKTDDKLYLVDISQKGDIFTTEIIKIYGISDAEAGKAMCNKCTEELKGQKLLGMNLVSGMKEVNGKLSEGNIIDIKKGKAYKCIMWLENQDRLKVRTMAPLIFKDQVWFREG
jgi:uncharacterized protein (DUF2147 family)